MSPAVRVVQPRTVPPRLSRPVETPPVPVTSPVSERDSVAVDFHTHPARGVMK